MVAARVNRVNEAITTKRQEEQWSTKYDPKTTCFFSKLLEVFGRHGLPLSLHKDRGSHYFHTQEGQQKWSTPMVAGYQAGQ